MKAYIGSGVEIEGHSLDVFADVSSLADTKSVAASGGVSALGISVAQNSAVSRYTPVISATVGDNVQIQLSGDLHLRSSSNDVANSDVDGVAISLSLGVGVAASLSRSELLPVMTTSIGDSTISARDVRLENWHNKRDGQLEFKNKSSVSNHTIDFGYDHGLVTGQPVTYVKGKGKRVQELRNSEAYYVVVVDSRRIRLAESQRDATKANPSTINISSAKGNKDELHRLIVGAHADAQSSGGSIVVGVAQGKADAKTEPTMNTSLRAREIVATGDVVVDTRSFGEANAEMFGVTIGGVVGVGPHERECR